MKKALMTGITGQDGSYLAEFLLSKGYEVHGIIRRASTFNTGRIDHIYSDPHEPQTRLFLHYGDLSDSEQTSNIVYNIRPDEVYHLGAQTHVKVSFNMPEYTGNVTGLGTVRILESIRRRGSWYLFDWPVLYPTISLLPAHMPYTLAQRGAMRLEDAIDIVGELGRILEDSSFTRSPCQAYRDPKKVEQTRQVLNGLLDQMQNAAKQLTFDGVFINDPRCKTFYDFDEKSPDGTVGDYERRENEAQTAEASISAASAFAVPARRRRLSA